jgi:hypothetical protein
LLPCGAVEGECCSWIANFLGLDGILHPTFLPCPVCAMSKQKSPDTVHYNQHYKQTTSTCCWSQQKHLWHAMGINITFKLCHEAEYYMEKWRSKARGGWYMLTAWNSRCPGTYISLPLKIVPDRSKYPSYEHFIKTGNKVWLASL